MTDMVDPIVAAQREQWDRASPAWGKWAEVFAQRNDGERYLELVTIRSGQRVLEIGAGTGDQTMLLARAVGPEGRVVATDLSKGMLGIAQARVQAAGLGNVDFLAGDVGTLGLEGGGFDAAVAGFVLMFVPDPDQAAAGGRARHRWERDLRERDAVRLGHPPLTSIRNLPILPIWCVCRRALAPGAMNSSPPSPRCCRTPVCCPVAGSMVRCVHGAPLPSERQPPAVACPAGARLRVARHGMWVDGEPGASTGPGRAAAAAPGAVPGGAPGRDPAGASSPAAAATETRATGRGFTEDEIKVGFVVISQTGVQETRDAFGADVGDVGDGRRQVNAVVNYINERGGVAGRRIVPVVVERHTQSSDPNQLESICARFVQDEKVYAVVTNFAQESQACYAQGETLLLNDNSESEFLTLRPLNPWIWLPGMPTREGGYAALVDGLTGQDYFSGDVKLGLVAFEDPETEQTYERVVLPRLRRLGHEPDQVAWLIRPANSQDQAQWAQQIQNAQLRFRAEGITHVFFMAPGGGAPIIFMNQAEAQLYRPRYGLSSYDTPGLLLQNNVPPTQLRDSVGAGFNMIADVDAQRGDPYPSGQAEKECHEALQSEGDSPPITRQTAINAAFICDGAFMLEAVGPALDHSLSIGSWVAGAEALGDRFQASFSLPGGTRFGPGVRAGGQSYRFLAYDASCGCFRYTSGNREFPSF